MIRLGILFEYATLNGGEQSLLAVIDQLRQSPGSDRVQFVACVPGAGPLLQALSERQIPWGRLAWRSPTGDRLPPGVLLSELLGLVQAHRLDLLHANSLAMGRILGSLAASLPCPTTVHLRDIIKLSRAAVVDLNRHHRLFAVSEATRNFHVQQGICSERTVTLHNGVDLELFQPRPRTGFLHRELQLPENARLAGTIGQICLRKGQNDLAEAAVLLCDHFPELHFLLIGERHSIKPESREADDRITLTFESAGQGTRLHRLGFRSDVARILNELDLLVHPARQEPLGRVLLEAAASGTPIVATRVGGTEEILTHRQSAWLVPPGEPQQLAQAIGKLLTDVLLRESLRNRARLVIEQGFTAARSAAEHLAHWEGVHAGTAAMNADSSC